MKIELPKESTMQSSKFTYGVATAAFQIEGGTDKRLPCIWDTFCSTEGKIADKSDGQIACDHFNLWQEDIELIASLGVDAYRLSISWPRVVNKDGSLNNEGVQFYINILDLLNQKNIKAFVTLYHWDLPQHIEDNGGWLNRETAYLFADYADKISQAFGNRVHSFATLNEPFCSAYLGYEVGIHAPGLIGKEFGKKAAHHLLLGHGLALQALQKNVPEAMNGIVLNFTPCYPQSSKEEDINAAHLADQHFNQWYIKPIMDGCYPELINELPNEHQPDIFPGDLEIISAKNDFLGINYYTRAVYRADDKTQFHQELPENTPLTDMGWEIYPQAFTELLVSLNSLYSLPPVYITENGAAMPDQLVNNAIMDLDRVDYFQEHLNAVNNAIVQGVNIQGYFAWSLMDNFEWAEGYEKRFGIVYVDYESQKRTLKHSGLLYSDFIKQRLITP
uniref:Beta-glucosidase n=1 Tax=Colwelliaceae bacterium D8 TaxID=1704085 RepID=A0A140JXI6_9GAMM|nr:beta-glucosidase [Colwelliaceae bacterium D8]